MTHNAAYHFDLLHVEYQFKVVPKELFACSFLLFLFFLQDLGLSTGRGRGHCKNQSCDYMYKNRHKPAVCPKCGCELTQKNAKGTKVKVVLLQRLQNQSAAVSLTLGFLPECQVVYFSTHDAVT